MKTGVYKPTKTSYRGVFYFDGTYFMVLYSEMYYNVGEMWNWGCVKEDWIYLGTSLDIGV